MTERITIRIDKRAELINQPEAQPTERAEDVTELYNLWPTIPDLDGIDLFSEYPIVGEQNEQSS